jgi:hypothetical protein
VPRRPRLLFGCLVPGSTRPFLLAPDGEGAPAGGAGGEGGGGTPPPPGNGPDGFPQGVPLAQMNDGQRAAYWQHYARQHEGRAKELATWQAENKAKVEGFNALEAASKTEAERAVETARTAALAEGQKAGRAEAVPHVIAAELRAASGGAITAEAAAKRTAYLDKTAFLGADGAIDMAKVTEYVTGEVGAAGPGTGGGGAPLPNGFPDLGQGPRGGAKITGKEAGLAEAKKRFGDKAAASA